MIASRLNDPHDPLIWYREIVRYGLDLGSAPEFAVARERLLSHPADDPELDALDAEAMENILQLPEVDEQWLRGHPEQPPEKWWWHLDALRQGDFPADRLPGSLRAIYRTARVDRKPRGQ